MIYTVRVKSGSSHEKVLVDEVGLTVYVKARPIDGKANDAVVKLLSKHFGVAKSQVLILRGLTSKVKHVQILQP